MWREWTTETIDEFEREMHDREPDTDTSTGIGLLCIVDAGELDMDALAAALT